MRQGQDVLCLCLFKTRAHIFTPALGVSCMSYATVVHLVRNTALLRLLAFSSSTVCAIAVLLCLDHTRMMNTISGAVIINCLMLDLTATMTCCPLPYIRIWCHLRFISRAITRMSLMHLKQICYTVTFSIRFPAAYTTVGCAQNRERFVVVAI